MSNSDSPEKTLPVGATTAPGPFHAPAPQRPSAPPAANSAHAHAGTPDQGPSPTRPLSTQPTSPEATRRSFMFLAALVAACLSAYFTVTMHDAGTARCVMAALAGGWFAMAIHVVRP